MMTITKVMILAMTMLACAIGAHAQAGTREQIKGLDEQIQEIKTDVLGIAAELQALEEKLLYPSDTQVAVFVSLASGENFRLDAVEVQLGGKPVAQHLYTFKELEALQKRGVERICTVNLMSEEHALQVSFLGKSGGGADLQRTASFQITKDVGPKIVEFTLASQDITLRDW
jgi:hypothetical protein